MRKSKLASLSRRNHRSSAWISEVYLYLVSLHNTCYRLLVFGLLGKGWL